MRRMRELSVSPRELSVTVPEKGYGKRGTHFK